MNRIILVCNYSADAQQSMLRFGAALRRALNDIHIQARVWHPPTLFARWASFDGARWGKLLGYFDKIVLGLPALLLFRLRHPDAIWHIVDQGNAGYAWVLPHRRTVVSVHDCFAMMAARDGRLGISGRILQRWIRSGLRSARLVLSVSHSTQNDLKNLGLSRSIVVHNALNQPYAPQPAEVCRSRLAEAGIPFDRPFLFHVGGNQWYKNRVGVVRIFGALRTIDPARDWRLVLAGKPWSASLAAEIRACGHASAIHDAGTVSNAVLEACYCTATAVVFPSLGEGFGWPVAEAQACGAIVVASNRPPLPEVGGIGAAYADPEDAVAYAKLILDTMPRRVELGRLALANARRFATGPWARMHRGVYRRLSGDSI